jgi:hypothetical protein
VVQIVDMLDRIPQHMGLYVHKTPYVRDGWEICVLRDYISQNGFLILCMKIILNVVKK